MVEGGDQADLLGQQHAVAKDVAGHIADTDHGERFGLDILAHLAEVTLDRFPGAAGGDAHFLVVISGRPARGECIAEPEVELFRGQAIGGVREGRRALVGGDHQIGVLIIPALGRARMNHGLIDNIVGQVEQAANEGLVGLASGFEDLLARSVARQGFGIETALRSDRDDNRILDLLCLYQAEHFGAEIIAAIGPAQPATGDRAEAQVDALDIRRPDKDFAIGLGQRKLFQQLARDLDRNAGLGLTIITVLVEIGPQSGFDEVEDTTQGPVMIETGHIIEMFAKRFGNLPDRIGPGFPVVGKLGVELDPRQFEKAAGDIGIGGQCFFLDRLRRIQTGLLAIARAGAQEGGFTPGHADFDDKTVEPVILGSSVGDGEQRVFEI